MIKTYAYWVSTGLLCLFDLASAVMYLTRVTACISYSER